MNEDSYLQERVDDQINYYNTKSIRNKRWYLGLSISQLISGVCISILPGTPFDNQLKYILLSLFGAGVTISTGLLSLLKLQEKWIKFRTTCEDIKHLKLLFLTRSSPYDDEKAFNLFVQHIESTISEENTSWGINELEKSSG